MRPIASAVGVMASLGRAHIPGNPVKFQASRDLCLRDTPMPAWHMNLEEVGRRETLDADTAA